MNMVAKPGQVDGRVLKLFVSSVPKKFEDLSGKKRDRYVTTVRLPDLPLEKIPSDPNPRNHTSLTSTKLDGLKSSIEENSGDFIFRNLGISIMAESTDYDPKTRELTIYLGKNGGVSNGNTTLNYCQEYGRESFNEHVMITVFTNIKESDALKMAEGQNTSVNVDQVSLLNLGSVFDVLKKQLKKLGVMDKVSFFQNDKKDIDVKYLVKLLVALKPENSLQTKIKSYISVAGCLSEYENNVDEYNNFSSCLKEIIELNDLIKLNAKEYYNSHTNGNALKLKIFSKSKDTRIFSKEYSNETISDSVFFPILSSYSSLFENDGTGYRLTSYAKKRGLEIIVKETLGRALEECKYALDSDYSNNLNALGKSSSVWKGLSGDMYKYTTEKFNQSRV